MNLNFASLLNYVDNFVFIKDAIPFYNRNWEVMWFFAIIYCPIIFGLQYLVKGSKRTDCLEAPLKWPVY